MTKSILYLLLFCSASGIAQPVQKVDHLTVDGISRQFLIYLPSGLNTRQTYPVLISLHGRFGTGKSMIGFADFRLAADRDKFIIVCPDGIDRSWNDGRPTKAEQKGINDVKFIDRLISYMITRYRGDSSRVYVTGMSNGGFLASRLACELSNRLAAVAIVAASMDMGAAYQPVKPIPIMYIQGTKDPLVPYYGGTMKGAGGVIYGHTDVLKLWAAADRCSSDPVITNEPDATDDSTNITTLTYHNPSTGIEVTGITVNNGGHTWPGGTQYLPKFIIGKVAHNLNACEAIWQFFKEYRLAK